MTARWALVGVIPLDELKRCRPEANTSLCEGVWIWSSLRIALHAPHLLTAPATCRQDTKQKVIKDGSHEQGTHSVSCVKTCKLLRNSTPTQYFIASIFLHAFRTVFCFPFRMPPGCSVTVSLSFQIKHTLPQQTAKPGDLCIVRKETLPFPPTALPQLELCRKPGPHVPNICCQAQGFCRLSKAINDTVVFLLTS